MFRKTPGTLKKLTKVAESLKLSSLNLITRLQTCTGWLGRFRPPAGFHVGAPWSKIIRVTEIAGLEQTQNEKEKRKTKK